MTTWSRGSLAVTLSAASGSLCLIVAGLVALNGHQPVAATTPLGPSAVVAPAVVAPAAAGATSAPAFNPEVPPVRGGVPQQLVLSGRVDVPVDPVGVSPDHGVDIPDDPSRAGWWAAGAAPGDPSGTTLLVGHLDSAAHGVGAFAALLDIRLGDDVTIRDSQGSVRAYVVTAREQVNKSALPASLFSTGGPARLVLVTCGGRFDPVTHHYDDNVIVTAEPRSGS